MSSRFHIDPNESIPVYEFEPSEVERGTPINCIVVRARMNVEIAGQVQDEMRKRNAASGMDGEQGVASVALLVHNILSWSGPDFDDLPCTPANIASLPPATLDPFIEKVINTIATNNRKRESPNARLPATPASSASAGEPDSRLSARAENRAVDPRPISLQLATTTSPSPLRSALAGHLNKSGD
jgi:hypothetical protein